MANYVKFMRGTPAAYQSLLNSAEKPNSDTLYFISEKDSNDAILYLGSKLIAGGNSDISLSLNDIANIRIEELQDKDLLVYDSSSNKWVNSTFEEAISVFIGASTNAAGKAGLVPAPGLGETNLYLRSDGKWAPIEAQHDANILTIENEDLTKMHQDIIDQATSDLLIAKGDIIIIKDIIAGDKYQHTSYVYNGATWAAMDGNYNAENVYFDEDFTFTEDVGVITIPDSGSIKVAANGKNIKDFLASIFAQEVNPSTTYPSASISSSTAKAYEAGTKVTPAYSVTFSAGSYTYGPATGVTATAYHVTDGTNTKDTASGSMPEIQVTDTTNYKISATVDHTDGVTPKTNIGNDYPSGAINEGTTEKVTSKAITGFRYAFVGPDTTGAALDSGFIRGLKAQGNGVSGHTVTWKASDTPGIKRYIVAIPASSSKKVSKVIITSSMNADCTADYVLQDTNVDVEGKNNFTAVPYKIWIYEPASIADVEVHQITIS